jgi:hypothetical protein
MAGALPARVTNLPLTDQDNEINTLAAHLPRSPRFSSRSPCSTKIESRRGSSRTLQLIIEERGAIRNDPRDI